MSVVNYNRFKPHSVAGLVGAGFSISVVPHHSQEKQFVAVTSCEFVIIWDIKKKAKVATLLCPEVKGSACVVSAAPIDPSNTLKVSSIAVGYSSGKIVLFTINELADIENSIFAGHSSAITCLSWNDSGTKLVSGATNGEIIIWDMVSERGIIKLRGHKGIVSSTHFLASHPNTLVSLGKDSSIKFWDILTGHCFRTYMVDGGKVTDFTFIKSDSRMVIAMAQGKLVVCKLIFSETIDNQELEKRIKIHVPDTDEKNDIVPSNDNIANDASILAIEHMGDLLRSKSGRIDGVVSNQNHIVCYDKYGSIDMYRINSDEQVELKFKKRLRKVRKRLREGDESQGADTVNESEPLLQDEVIHITCFSGSDKLNSILLTNEKEQIYLTCLGNNNSLSVLKYNSEESVKNSDKSEMTLLSQVLLPGHRNEIKAVQFSSVGGDIVVSLSSDTLKCWYKTQYECEVSHTIPISSYSARCFCLTPDDRHVVIGTSSGKIILCELSTGRVLLDTLSFSGENESTVVTSLCLTADKRGLLVGGANSIVRCWRFEYETIEESRSLTLLPTEHFLKVNDSISALSVSPDGRFIAVATLDNKETLYYADTMKLHQELYGKSMPSMCLAFSDDGSLLITGCKDSALRIHGTDFGDIRKLLKGAHTGGVSCVQFQGKTKLFFSAGYDSLIHYWDAGSFNRIMTLRGHFGVIRSMSLSPKGNYLVTGGEDRSLRMWERTEELLELEHEREEERRQQEEEMEETALAGQVRHVEGETINSEAVRATKATFRSEEIVDRIIEALDMYRKHIADPDAAPHYLMLTYNIDDPLLCFRKVLHSIKSSEIEEAIIQLNLSHILSVLVVICRLGERNLLSEVCVRICIIAVRTNLTQLMSSRSAAPVLRKLNECISNFTSGIKKKYGVTHAGLQVIADHCRKENDASALAEALDRRHVKNKKQKKQEKTLILENLARKVPATLPTKKAPTERKMLSIK